MGCLFRAPLTHISCLHGISGLSPTTVLLLFVFPRFLTVESLNLTSHSHSQGSRVSLKIAGDKGDQQMQYGRPYEIQDSSLPSPQSVPGLRKFSLAGLPSHPALLHPGYHHFFGSLFTLEAVSSLAYSLLVSSFSRQQLSSLSQC